LNKNRANLNNRLSVVIKKKLVYRLNFVYPNAFRLVSFNDYNNKRLENDMNVDGMIFITY